MIELNPQATAVVDEASAPFLGQWNRLVSTTNWEKGRIIHEWRQALVAAAAPASEYADEAWSQRIGNVTGQHVGRLRRVYEQFDALRAQHSALYWSHFQAALDWDDAPMWLEGAYQSGWSVAEMRRQRWETLGAVEADRPSAEQAAGEPIDEDSEPTDARDSEVAAAGRDDLSATNDRIAESNVDRDRSKPTESNAAPFDSDDAMNSPGEEPRRPFANLAELPDDLGEPFEALKLAIIRHKFAGWQEISRDDVVTAIDALRELALALAE